MNTQRGFCRRPVVINCPASGEEPLCPCPLHEFSASRVAEGRKARPADSPVLPPLVLDPYTMPADLAEVLEARDRSWTEQLELLAACQDCQKEASRVRVKQTLQTFRSFRQAAG